MMAKGELSEKQQRFAEEYLIDLNATQAAIRAGYSEKTAQEQASRLLSNVMVQKFLQEAVCARQERTKVSQDKVIWELAGIAFAAAGQDENVKVRDKLRALELLGKHLGMFADKVQMELRGGVEEYLRKLEENDDRSS